VLGVLAIFAIPIIAILRLILGFQFLGGQVTMIVIMLLVGAFQLFFLFILGQYVARIYDETRGRPLYIVADKVGFDTPKNVSPEIKEKPLPEPQVEG